MSQAPPPTPAWPSRLRAVLALLTVAAACGGGRAISELERRGLGLETAAFLEAVERDDAAAVDLYLRAGLASAGGLITAAWHGHCDLLGELLAGGVAAEGLAGAEALVRSQGRGHPVCTERLTAAGARLDARSQSGESLLIRSARQGDSPARLKRLLELGADPRLATKSGTTALMHAVRESRARSVRILLAAGADVGARDLDGWTALHFAARAGSAAVARALLAAGARVDASTGLGWTPLQLAARDGGLAVVQLLAGAGADLDATSRVAPSPLILALQAGRAKVAMALLAAGAEPDLAVAGRDAAWWARRSGAPAVVALVPRLAGGAEEGS